jgi:SET domain-containing protein
MAKQKSTSSAGQKPDPKEPNEFYEVRKSGVHGYGGFAKKDLKKGTRITEYLGDRISHREADQRYEDHDESDNHTFLFIVNRRTVIDAGVGGNNARFINHQCDPNCTSVIEDNRVWIETVRDVKKGEELGYDYEIGREKNDPENVDEIYACRCGSPKCRGTMLSPPTRAEYLAGLAKERKKKKKKSAQKGGKRTRSAKKK